MSTTIFLVNPVNFGGSGASYLVDDYSIASAYSLRKIANATTNVIRVRRDSDNAESDFSDTDITDGTLTAWTGANNGFVAIWYNQGTDGSANDLPQTTATSQPKIVTSGVVETKNGLPCVTFDGSNDTLQLTSSNVWNSNGNDTSTFTVSHSDTNNDYAGIIKSNLTIVNPRIQVFHDRRTQKRALTVQATTNGSADMSAQRNDSNQRLLACFVLNKNLSSFDNSATGGTATYTGNYTNSHLFVGRNGSKYLNGSIQEIIIHKGDLTADRTTIETEINTHYSIY